MKKMFVPFSILVILVIFLASCATPPESEKPFRVAVVMPSKIDDLAQSQSMYDALVAIQKEMGADKFEFVYSQNMSDVEVAAAAIRDYAAKGYNLVIAHGSQYRDSLQEIAPDFPEVSFAWGSSVDTFTDKGINNVFAYEARAEQGGYVNGLMAAKLTKSGKIGVVGPIETADPKLYVEGFKKGVADTNPNVEVLVTWTGSFSDVALASEAAQTQITSGADVLTGVSQGAVGAIDKAKESNVVWFGTQSNQTSLAPEIVAACQVYHWEVALTQIIDQIEKGALGGQSFQTDLKNKGEVIEYNEGYQLPEDVKAAAQAAIDGIINGSIKPLP